MIVGGGYIGLEAAEALVRRGVRAALVEAAPRVMNRIDPDMGSSSPRRSRTSRSAPRGGGRGDRGRRARVGRSGPPGAPEPTWSCSASAPGRPCGWPSPPASSSARAAPSRSTPRMQTRHGGVWAAGDCAEARHLVSGKPVSYHLGTIANKQGRACGINIGGGYATFPGVLAQPCPRCATSRSPAPGCPRTSCATWAWNGSRRWSTRPPEPATSRPADPDQGAGRPRSGRLLGVIVGKGRGQAHRRVRHRHLERHERAGDEVNLDLSYAPPFSPVWDPVLIAVHKLAEQVERSVGDQV